MEMFSSHKEQVMNALNAVRNTGAEGILTETLRAKNKKK